MFLGEQFFLVGLPESRHDERVVGKCSRGLDVSTLGLKELKQVHLYILNNNNEVVLYIVLHEALVKESNLKMTKNKVTKKNNKIFLNWFKDEISAFSGEKEAKF